MYWNENIVQKLEWNGEISNLEEKQAIAENIRGYVDTVLCEITKKNY